MKEHTSTSSIGLPSIISQKDADRLCTALRQTWVNNYKSDVASLDGDLNSCRRFFDPVAQGQRLRRELADLPSLPNEVPDPGPPLTFAVAPGKRLVTPEGRCALHLLESLPTDRPALVINDADLLVYDRLLADLYREWSRHRLKSVVELLSGANKPIQIPAAGVVVALLVNRCTNERRGLTRFASGEAREVVDRAFFTPVQAFADILAPSGRRNRGDPKLVSGWMLYEARRRLGDHLVIVDARGGADGSVWVKEDAEHQVIEIIARDLARGHRSRVTPAKFGVAYDALVARLRDSLPSLAAFGLVHERPIHTEDLRRSFLAALGGFLSASN